MHQQYFSGALTRPGAHATNQTSQQCDRKTCIIQNYKSELCNTREWKNLTLFIELNQYIYWYRAEESQLLNITQV